jgi:hypothetical protein
MVTMMTKTRIVIGGEERGVNRKGKIGTQVRMKAMARDPTSSAVSCRAMNHLV